MRVLFFVGLWCAQGNILFFEGALLKKVLPQVRQLCRGRWHVSLVVNEILHDRLPWREIPDGVVVHRISLSDIHAVSGGLRDRQADLYREPDSALSKDLATYFGNVIADAPDVIVARETPVSSALQFIETTRCA